MSLYPSLEDMKVDQMVQAQRDVSQAAHQQQQTATAPPDTGVPAYPGTAPAPAYPVAGNAPYPVSYASAPAAVAYNGVGMVPPAYAAVNVTTSSKASVGGSLYPSLDEYMGLAMATIAQNTVAVPQSNQVATRPTAAQMQVAPVSGGDLGIIRSEVKQGIREVTLCKDGKGKMGLRVRAISKGVFVALVHKGSPAAMAGLRFGDQILQINGENVAGWSNDKAMKFLLNCNPQKIVMALRDRPFERTVTMQKDSTGHVGFTYRKGKITALIKDSSAARNGLLIDHQLIEVNGQNVVGLKDNDLGDIFSESPRTVTVTLMPTFLYDHMVKCMGTSLIQKGMDHSIPEV